MRIRIIAGFLAVFWGLAIPVYAQQAALCPENEAYLSYAYNSTDACYGEFFTDISNVMCAADIEAQCNGLSYPDEDSGLLNPIDCVNSMNGWNVATLYTILSKYYNCEATSAACSPGAIKRIGNQLSYCDSTSNTWLPTKNNGASCTHNYQCTSSRCSGSCQQNPQHPNNLNQEAPYFTSIGGQAVVYGQVLQFTAPIGQNLSLVVSATNIAGGAIIYSAANLPTGANFTSSGVFSWTPQAGQHGKFAIELTATNNAYMTTVISVVITSGNGVNNTNPLWSGSITFPANLRTVTMLNGNTYACLKTLNGIDSYVNLAASATGGLGVSFMQFSSDSISWGPLFSYSTTQYLNSLPYTIAAGDGIKNIYVRFKDVAGNLSPVYSVSFILDTAAPTGSMMINNGAASTNSTSVNLTFTVNDNLAGVSFMRITNDQLSWDTVPYSVSATWNLPLPVLNNSSQTVFVKFEDTAGNQSQVYFSSILVTVKPDLTVTDLTFTPASPTPGGALTVSFKVKNIGTANAAAHQVRVGLFKDNIHDFGSKYVDIGPLNAGAEQAVSTTFNHGSTMVGAHSLKVFGDRINGNVNNTTGAIDESDETNNISSATVTFVAVPSATVAVPGRFFPDQLTANTACRIHAGEQYPRASSTYAKKVLSVATPVYRAVMRNIPSGGHWERRGRWFSLRWVWVPHYQYVQGWEFVPFVAGQTEVIDQSLVCFKQ